MNKDISAEYLECVKKSLLNWSDIGQTYWKPAKTGILGTLNEFLTAIGLTSSRLCQTKTVTLEEKTDGTDWQTSALTMIGKKRLDSLHDCIKDVLDHDIPGDFIETGVWKGGTCIFMRAALNAYGNQEKKVWVADSFQGLPPVNSTNPMEFQYNIDPDNTLAIPLEQVKEHFRQYNLLDAQVAFLEGWFKDTLPTAPIEKLSILRLDGDYYESTMDALVHLYPKLSPGGYVIIDDYALVGCKNAVQDYRKRNNITEEMVTIDWTGIYWKKQHHTHL